MNWTLILLGFQPVLDMDWCYEALLCVSFSLEWHRKIESRVLWMLVFVLFGGGGMYVIDIWVTCQNVCVTLSFCEMATSAAAEAKKKMLRGYRV